MGLDKGEVGEAHGPVPYCGGPLAWLTHQTAGLPRERQQTGASEVPGFHGVGSDREGPHASPPHTYGQVAAFHPLEVSCHTVPGSFPCHLSYSELTVRSES